MTAQHITPFLKWAGRKLRIVKQIKQCLPHGTRLIEPFVGSGAVFLNCDYPENILADANNDLINIFTCVQQAPDDFIHDAKTYFAPGMNDKDTYYQLRDTFNQSQDPWQRALLFLYLNRHGYNGLCRFNSSGGFNVPFGFYEAPPRLPEEKIRQFHTKAKNVQFICSDYQAVMKKARPGDIIYCDPPYVPLSRSSRFTQYDKNSFSLDDQLALAELAKTLCQKNITVLLSNHDLPFTRKAYQGAVIKSLDVKRFISCKAEKRTAVKELLALFKPTP